MSTTTATPITTARTATTSVRRLNHVALKVRSVQRSVDFYAQVFGFTEDVGRFGAGRSGTRTLGSIAFLRAPGSTNHHDLALLEIGPDAEDMNGAAIGMFHFAFEVETLRDLAALRARLVEQGCLHEEADHGATKAIYARDPDGYVIEITWVLPRSDWGAWETAAPIKRPLDLEGELARWS